ncbi:MAG: DoxX family protein [Syntrophobacteraceae bacterium]
MNWFFETDRNVQNLILRVFLGAVMFPHGAQKLLGWYGGRGVAATIDAFSNNLHIPAALTVLVIAAESFGAIALILGFMTRFCAFGILCDMIGAIFIVHLPYGFFMNWFGKQPGEGFEYHLLAIGMALALMLTGGGRLSADRLVSEKLYPGRLAV